MHVQQLELWQLSHVQKLMLHHFNLPYKILPYIDEGKNINSTLNEWRHSGDKRSSWEWALAWVRMFRRLNLRPNLTQIESTPNHYVFYLFIYLFFYLFIIFLRQLWLLGGKKAKTKYI